MNTYRTYLALLLAVLTCSAASADPIPEIYGINKNGVIFKFDKASGVAKQVKVLNSTRLQCAPDTYRGLAFVGNFFYTSCRQIPVQYPCKLIRFSFVEGDETVFRSPAVSSGTGMENFDWMLPWNAPGDPLTFFVRGRTGFDTVSAYYNVGTGESTLINVNTPNYELNNIFGAEPHLYFAWITVAGVPGGKAPAIMRWGLPTSTVECLLVNSSGQQVYPYWSISELSSNYGTTRFDPVTGDVWGIGDDALGSSSILVRLRVGTLTNYCTGSYQGYPALNSSVDAAPRVVSGYNNDPIVGSLYSVRGITFAPDYFSRDEDYWKPVEMLLRSVGD